MRRSKISGLRQVIVRVLCVAGLALGAQAQAQLLGDAAWQEAEVPEPPAFNLERLLRFEVNPNSSLVYAIDPQTLSISPQDRVVRYVIVASSPGGVRNVFYEGIRCPAGQVKTYARYSEGRWIKLSDPQWQDMASRPSRHALQLARQGGCDNSGTPLRPDDILRALRQTGQASVR
ncbi:MAG: hypothetical protein RLZZ180_363 [Pseudomonadota bacterium]|jgi:hypothetical protein